MIIVPLLDYWKLTPLDLILFRFVSFRSFGIWSTGIPVFIDSNWHIMYKTTDPSVDSKVFIKLKNLYSPEHPIEGIKVLGINDVRFGRGGGSNCHEGNVKFRLFIEKYKKLYLEAKRSDKPQIALTIVTEWRQQDPPGRFLTLAVSDTEKKDDMEWCEVGDAKAREKVSQTLREKNNDKSKRNTSTKDSSNPTKTQDMFEVNHQAGNTEFDVSKFLMDRPIKPKRETSHEIHSNKEDKRPANLINRDHSSALKDLPGGSVNYQGQIPFEGWLDEAAIDYNSLNDSQECEKSIPKSIPLIELSVEDIEKEFLGFDACLTNIDSSNNVIVEQEPENNELFDAADLSTDPVLDEIPISITDIPLSSSYKFESSNGTDFESADLDSLSLLSGTKPKAIDRESTFPHGLFISPESDTTDLVQEKGNRKDADLLSYNKPLELTNDNRETTCPYGSFIPPKLRHTFQSEGSKQQQLLPRTRPINSKPSSVNRETSLCSIASELSMEFSELELNSKASKYTEDKKFNDGSNSRSNFKSSEYNDDQEITSSDTILYDSSKVEGKVNNASDLIPSQVHSSIHSNFKSSDDTILYDLSKVEGKVKNAGDLIPSQVDSSIRSISYPVTTFIPPGRTRAGQLLREMLREHSR